MKELLNKLRRYEIEIRKAITSQMQGNFHSIFKGSGIEFDDVRAYQYGDDTRSIDWNVTAKGHGTFVKTFKEEKEQTVFFIMDLSASQEIGAKGKQKIDIGKEICGVLTLSAIKESSQVGLIGFTDVRELYIKPSKGMKHAYQIITNLFNYQTSSRKTNLNKAIAFALNLVKRRSVIILISDFIDDNYWKNLKALSKKHDLVIIHIFDNMESNLPRLGIIPLYDKETGKTHWINTSSPSFRQKLVETFDSNQNDLQQFCKKHQVNYLSINTQENYVPMLIKLFNLRNKTKAKSV
ncbi:MAG: DUF58 domain-containing protein [Bacteroidetes bacterium]|nr:MAG: DUF58 domain-containing protein [Bacteroidota bacterium]